MRATVFESVFAALISAFAVALMWTNRRAAPGTGAVRTAPVPGAAAQSENNGLNNSNA